MPVIEAKSKLLPNFSDILIRPLVPLKKGKKVSVKVDLPGTASRWQPGSNIFSFQVPEFDDEMYREFLSFMAKKYKERVKQVIERQEFRDKWEPLSEKYIDWKRKAKLDKRIWVRSGQLLKAIRVRFFPQVSSYGVGIDANKTFKEIITIKNNRGEIIGHRIGRVSDTPILYIARIMEFGSSHMPARPLFGPVREELAKNIRPFFNEFVRQKGIEVIG